jgi:hypothetical protein
MRTIEVKEIIVSALPGSAIWDCQYDAALLALTEKRTVRLIHNEQNYVITPSDVMESFKKI